MACCAVPLLAAAGVGGSVLTCISGYLRPGAELAVAGVAGIGAFAVFAARSRKARASAGRDGGSAAGGCACGSASRQPSFSSADPAPDEPVICTADLRDKPAIEAQMNGYRAAFAELRRTERFTHGFRWVFEPRPGLEAALCRLAENEQRCCGFFKYEVWRSADSIVWQTTADERAASVLEEYSQLPLRLGDIPAGGDLGPLKASAQAAGLVFAADRARAE
jgi:hypothetical protein